MNLNDDKIHHRFICMNICIIGTISQNIRSEI